MLRLRSRKHAYPAASTPAVGGGKLPVMFEDIPLGERFHRHDTIGVNPEFSLHETRQGSWFVETKAFNLPSFAWLSFFPFIHPASPGGGIHIERDPQ